MPSFFTAQSPLPDSSALEASILPDDRLPQVHVLSADVRDMLHQQDHHQHFASEDRLPPYVHGDGYDHYAEDIKVIIEEEDLEADDPFRPARSPSNVAPSLLDLYSRSPKVDLETGGVVFEMPSGMVPRRGVSRLAHRRRSRRRCSEERDARVQVLSCVALTCFLSALVAAYISQAVSPHKLHPALHTIFIVAILATTVGLAWFTARLTKRTQAVPRHLWAVRHHRHHRHHHGHHRRHHRRHRSGYETPKSSAMSITSSAGLLITPPELLPTPPAARVASMHSALKAGYLISDWKAPTSPRYAVEVLPGTPVIHSPRIIDIDLEMAQLPDRTPRAVPRPSARSPAISTGIHSPAPWLSPRSDTGDILPSTTFNPASPRRPIIDQDLSPTLEDEDGSIMIQAPPPAYGRWRGSIQVDPDFLRWRPMSLQEVRDATADRRDVVEVCVYGEQSDDDADHRTPRPVSDRRSHRRVAETETRPSAGGGVTLIAEVRVDDDE